MYDELSNGRAWTKYCFCYELAARIGCGCLFQRVIERPFGDVLLSVWGGWVLTAAFSSVFFSFHVLSAAGASTTLISVRLIINFVTLAVVD